MTVPPLRGRILEFAGTGCTCGGPMRLGLAGDRVCEVVAEPEAATGGTLLMAPFANAHDHVRGVKPLSLGAFDLPLELWLTSMTNIPPVEPALVAATALGRQALGGVGTIMIHYTRPRDPGNLVAELARVAAAAETIGVRVAIAVAMRDQNPLGYGPDETILQGLDPADAALVRDKLMPVPLPPAEQVRLVEDLAAQVESPLCTVQFGPYGLEWCSDPLLRLIASRSAESGRRVHMHFLESPLQRGYLDHAFAGAPVSYLDAIGLLSPRLSVAHAVWLRPDEMDLFAERGVTVSTNASSNLSLRSGVAPVGEMHRRGVPLAMGLDGFSVDDDDDAFRELRLNYMLHKGVSLDEGLALPDLFRAACYGGRRSVAGLEPGAGLAPGALADVMALDYAAITRDVAVPVDPATVLAGRGTARLLRRLVVGGREVVRDGVLTGLDLPAATAELEAQVRHGAPAFTAWRQVSDRLGARLKSFYAAGMHRCG